MNIPLHGLVAATHTPFHPDGSLAPEVVPLQAAHLSKNGIRTVFITGSTGESHSLTRDERLAVFRAWAEAAPAHDLTVVAHAGSNCLEDAKVFAAAAADLGLDAVAALAPSYYKPDDLDTLIDCCALIAGAAPGLPFYYYDIPALTGVCLPMREFLAKAPERIPNLAGVKFTNDDLDDYSRCLKVGDFDIPWGIDEQLLAALQAGARGAVGSSYNFAAPLYRRLIQAFEDGDLETATRLQREAIELIEALAAVGYLGAVKAIMEWQGVPLGPARLPLANPSPAQLESLHEKFDSPVLQP
ncbi:dihydrodipicolinate synthase family protein [Haloferula sp. A504]|uniref:dihydrodipicolinate synthase family protein n=1 Tax=Haloferula sp. A504 TaxID=3373601 RepID=UPI0031BEACF4|nr:dihydrodipicolinate synthase family protein [Verrucomicrobiaceae bacterium E54]